MPPLVNGFQLPTYTGYGFTVWILDDFWKNDKDTMSFMSQSRLALPTL
jgi:hypothetical protein